MSNKIKNKLNIFLIKEEIKEIEQIVKNSDKCEKIDLNDNIFFYYRKSILNKPSWINEFFGENSQIPDFFHNANSAVLLLLKVKINDQETRFFVLTFGFGTTLLDNNSIEERFGIKTVLNLIGENDIRGISKTSIGGNNKITREQMPKYSSILEFGFNIDSDLINGLSAKPVINRSISIIGTISGHDSFICSSETDIINIMDFLKSIYEIYKKDSYKENFEWIDRIQPVKNKKIIKELDVKLFEEIMNYNSGICEFWMAVPQLIEWEYIKGFKISGFKHLVDDIYIQDVLNSFKKKPSSIDSFKNKKIFLINSRDEKTETWDSYKCILGEAKIGKEMYCINNGKWYKIDQDYVEKITSQYKNSQIYAPDFIDYQYGTEEEYNKQLAISNPENFLCLDRKNVVHGLGKSRFEICDILSKDKSLIHIKKYGGSALLGHLFNQGLASAELIRQDQEFIDKANKIINNDSFLLSKTEEYNVVFGIITNSKEEIPNIPFFSKIIFNQVSKQLTAYGYKVYIKKINKIESTIA